MTPYYHDDAVTIYHGDAREELPDAAVMVTDPPYGIGYRSSWAGTLSREIVGDVDTSLRDHVLATTSSAAASA